MSEEGQEFLIDESVDLSDIKMPFPGLAEIWYRKITKFSRTEIEMGNINYLHYLFVFKASITLVKPIVSGIQL